MEQWIFHLSWDSLTCSLGLWPSSDIFQRAVFWGPRDTGFSVFAGDGIDRACHSCPFLLWSSAVPMSCWEPGDLCEAAYISVNAHNVAILLQAGSLPSGLLMWGAAPSVPGTGSRPPPLPFFSKPRELGKFGGLASSCFFRV